MTQLTEQLLNQALQLSQDEREELADQLYLSLHGTPDSQHEVEAAWDQEVARRLNGPESDKASLYSAEQVHGDISKILKGN